jgi:23S rRNA (pseudouridine1915-N3)-methyltransferase
LRIVIVAIGRAKPGPARSLYEEYRARLTPPPELIELEERRPLPAGEMKRREGELILAALARRPGRARITVALDEAGRNLATLAFAKMLGDWRTRGIEEAAFLIGGADGLDQPVKQAADLILSLGPMTWPHLLVRGLLAEQLYRAQQIAAGHPYHRG